MCGICGIVSADPLAVPDRAFVERMRDAIAHRGPDGVGTHISAGVGLGHRRLSIVDLAGGHQPMSTGEGRLTITYNGEIFNHPSLKRQLEAEGARYRTRSDTETILHLWERYGDDAVKHLRGMFAFAIWDQAARRLVLARDRFGVKPLYYLHRPDGGLVFASEIKALVETGAATAELNHAALPDFLANHAPSGNETLFRDIKRLPPGHTLSWQAGKVAIRRYWDLSFAGSIEAPAVGSEAVSKFVDEYRERLTEAIRLRLMSDVPLGMFLSGGIDSAAITALMSSLVNEPVRTFSVAFAEREANELHYARLVANAFSTEHHEVTVTPEQFFQSLPRLVWHEDEPIAHPSSIALNAVSELAARHVKVVLTGEGSDETLAGYNRYRVTAFNARLAKTYERVMPATLRSAVRKGVQALPARLRFRQIASRTFLTRSSSLDDLYFDNFAVFARAAQHVLLTPEARAAVGEPDPYAAHHEAMARVADQPLLTQLLYADVSTYLHELLMKQDQMSMAASIESRVPFLDHPLVEWITSLPASFKLRGTTTKWVLRAAMRDRLPPEILTRRKMGFPVPIGAWLRGPWRHLLDEYLTSGRTRARGLFDQGVIVRLVQEHLAGIDHSERLWSLLNFEVWARIYLDRQSVGEIPVGRAA